MTVSIGVLAGMGPPPFDILFPIDQLSLNGLKNYRFMIFMVIYLS